MTKSSPHPAVGIDLGTTFSTVAFLDASGRPETIRNSEGGLTTPSAIFFDHDRPIVGIEAMEAGLQEPERLALYAKRDVGEVRYEKEIRGEALPPEVLQALVLRKLKEDAELKLGPISKAVITVPAFFNEPCRKATQDAGALAGLEVLDIINEPTAAAITYGVEQGFLSPEGRSDKLERVLVYDLGGGTFDVTLMEIEGKRYDTIATAGDVYLGGIDWDRRIVDFIAEAFIEQHDVDPRTDPCGEQELLRKANQAKHALTQRDSVSVAMAHDGMRLRTELTRAKFDELSEDLVERTLMTIRLVLDDAAVAWSDLTRLILVGGSTRMPMIRSELEKQSGMNLDRSLSPDEAVSHGAAVYAGILLGHGAESFAGVSVSNVNSHDLGVLAVDPRSGNPRRQIMIPRNSTLPAQKRIRFRTHSENQKNVKIQVVEGGDDRGINATQIGKCLVEDLPTKMPKGTLVDVHFDYSQDGRLTVGASLPEIDCQATMTLNLCAAGLSDETLQQWSERIHSGLGDPDPERVAEASESPAENASDAGIETLVGAPQPQLPVSIQVGPPKSAKKQSAQKPDAQKPEAKQQATKKQEAKPGDHEFARAKKEVPMDLPPVAPPPKKPTAKKPDAKTPTAKKPTAKKPTAKKPTAKKPDAKTPAAKSSQKDTVAETIELPFQPTGDKKSPAPHVKPGRVKIELPGGASKPTADSGEIESALADFLGGGAPKESSAPQIAIDVSTPPESGGRKKLKRLKKTEGESDQQPAAPKKLKKKSESGSEDSDSNDWKNRRVKLSSPDGNEEQ